MVGQSDATKGPLDGIHVLEWAVWQAGPIAATMLGDLGADVIKIEQPVVGDPIRGLQPGMNPDDYMLPGGRASLFETFNRNKKDMVLNLKHEKGKEIVARLVQWADVVIHNFFPEIAQEVGMDYPTLSKVNPRLVYASMSAYGKKGPDNHQRAFDVLGQARSGIMTLINPIDEPPAGVSGAIADMAAGWGLAYGVIAALLARERLGIGQEVDASLLSGMISLQTTAIGRCLLHNRDWPGRYRTDQIPANPLWHYYRCGDGKWLAITILQTDRFWPDFCRTVGIEELEKDPKFDNMQHRAQNAAELVPTINKVFASKPRQEWLEIFRETDMGVCPVNAVLDLPSDPQCVANNYIINFDHPVLGPVKLPGLPANFSKTPGGVRMPAPEFGQHTEEILVEELGYTWDDIEQLREQKVI